MRSKAANRKRGHAREMFASERGGGLFPTLERTPTACFYFLPRPLGFETAGFNSPLLGHAAPSPSPSPPR